MVVPTSAAAVLSLLEEKDLSLKTFALEKLNTLVPNYWAEISDAISKIEVLYEDSTYQYRSLAALVASKVYYHLGEYEEALTFALGAESLFDLSEKSQYVEMIITKCIDKYIELRRAHQDSSQVAIDRRLEDIVERMFNRCYEDGEFHQAIGIALEAYRLDIVEICVSKIDISKRKELLNYILTCTMNLVEHIGFRNNVLRLLVKLYETTIVEPDYDSIFQCLVHLNDPTHSVHMLKVLVARDEPHRLIGYQIAFDLEDCATQEFLNKMLTELPPVNDPLDEMQTDQVSDIESEDAVALKNISKIISGELTIRLNLEFLSRNNHADMLILKNSKNALNALSANSSAYHSAITFANAFMNAGTTSDEFLRQNLEWLSKASNWTKFSATAALGVIHRGQIEQGKTILKPYLPQEGVSSSPFSEGGSLFALGMINANHGKDVLDFLTTCLKNTTNEVVQVGGCLGIGAAAMATDDNEIFELLKSVLFSDSAVAGEAAGIAMGLVMAGTNNGQSIQEMLQYAHETQHEKIIRGLAIGIAMVVYGREEEADLLIEQMCVDKDPILRYGCMFAIAMAYCGTGNNKAIRKLLHVAVSDVNDDVRRASVIAIGFVLCRKYQQVPRVVQLLSESYNPYVRYGATLALGISCAGTGLQEAVDLLEPLLKDSVDFVKQGALIAMGMILVEHNEAMSKKVKDLRDTYETTIAHKHADAMAKFGAVLGQGILDAGGRNVTLSLLTQNRVNLNMVAVLGMALFTQFWYWYPLTHFLSLSFRPTALIGLNCKLQIPKFSFLSNAKPSWFAYTPATKPPTAEVVERVATAVLSTTAKSKARQRRQDKEKGKETEDMEVETPAQTKKELEQPLQEEESFEVKENLSRVLPSQIKYVSFSTNNVFTNARYVPIKKERIGGIVLMKDLRSTEPEEIIPLIKPKMATPVGSSRPASASTDNVPSAPAPFEYNED